MKHAAELDTFGCDNTTVIYGPSRRTSCAGCANDGQLALPLGGGCQLLAGMMLALPDVNPHQLPAWYARVGSCQGLGLAREGEFGKEQPPPPSPGSIMGHCVFDGLLVHISCRVLTVSGADICLFAQLSKRIR